VTEVMAFEGDPDDEPVMPEEVRRALLGFEPQRAFLAEDENE